MGFYELHPEYQCRTDESYEWSKCYNYDFCPELEGFTESEFYVEG